MTSSLNFKHIILWRHADAEPLAIDQSSGFDRVLTETGEIQAKKMAKWLRANLPKNTLILSSPTKRTLQTAEALKKSFRKEVLLSPDTTVKEVVEMLAMINTENILLIGHQPWLDLLINVLINTPSKNSVGVRMASIKKGAVWWFKQSVKKPCNVKLLAVQRPNFL